MHAFSDPLTQPSDSHRDLVVSATDARFLRWLKNDLFLRVNQMCLIISGLKLEPVGLGANCELAGAGQDTAEARSTRRFASCSFNRVYVHRAVRSLPEVEYAAELSRILQPGGVVVAAAYHEDFSFAPLPAGAEAHLLRRMLISAGFVDLRTEHTADGFIAISARRKLDPILFRAGNE